MQRCTSLPESLRAQFAIAEIGCVFPLPGLLLCLAPHTRHHSVRAVVLRHFSPDVHVKRVPAAVQTRHRARGTPRCSALYNIAPVR